MARFIKKHRNEIGLSPFELIFRGEQKIDQVQLSVINYSIDILKEKDGYMINLDAPKKIKITIHMDMETNCSCLDWRTRCKNLGIACKHLYYLL